MVSTIMSQKSVVFCEVHSNEPFPTVFKFFFSDLALGNAPRIALNTSHLECGLLQLIETIINLIVSCNIAVGKRGRLVTAAKSTAVPQSIRSVKSISLCMFALVCNNYNLHPKQA